MKMFSRFPKRCTGNFSEWCKVLFVVFNKKALLFITRI